jgi:hypothetical protein
MEKYDEDLNTTLIFVRFVSSSAVRALTKSQAGLFSAVTSAFIIEVHSHLQQDPNDVTAALLRVLLYKIDNTTFGNDPPTLPQWTGPPRTIVHVQAILLASLATSLFSAFLAMLGKQWLNRYASTEMRGTAIERSQNRQRKLDGIVKWYFDHVMEALPLMLQIALLLLGCALSRYLWEINVTIASVVIGVTSIGVVLYIFVVVAGAASESCPYQTPGARILRHIFHQISRHILLPARREVSSAVSKAPAFVSSRFSAFIEASFCRLLAVKWRALLDRPWYTMFNIVISLICALVVLPIALATDACLLLGVMYLLLVGFGGTVCSWLLIAFISATGYPIYFCWTVCRRFVGDLFAQPHGLDRQTIALDLRCISWMLRASLDKAVHLSALEHLATMTTLGNFDPALVLGCFDVFIDCIKVDASNHKVVVVQGLEQLAAVSAMCFLRTLHHLSVMNPTSAVLEDVDVRYYEVFSYRDHFSGLPFHWTMTMIHSLVLQFKRSHDIQWDVQRPSAQECISFARGMAEIAQVKYQQTQHRKVPRWILRFALRSLSLEPLPPASAVADCLSIIAIDLGCDVSNTGFAVSDEKSVCISQMTIILTLNQCASGTSCKPGSSESQNNDRW